MAISFSGISRLSGEINAIIKAYFFLLEETTTPRPAHATPGLPSRRTQVVKEEESKEGESSEANLTRGLLRTLLL